MISDQINVHMARELGSLDRGHRVHVNKLSTGKRIATPGHDVGGYSLAIKHASAARRTQATLSNMQNVYSYAQTQEGVLQNIGKMYARMDELAAMSMDPTKTDTDRTLYDKEFQELRDRVVKSRSSTTCDFFAARNINSLVRVPLSVGMRPRRRRMPWMSRMPTTLITWQPSPATLNNPRLLCR